MNKNIFFTSFLVLVFSGSLAACIPGFFAAPVISDLDLISTAAAHTVDAQMTQAVISDLITQLTQAAQQQDQATATGMPPTATQIPPTATLELPTATQVPPTTTATQIPPTSIPPTSTPIPCNWLMFVKDVTVPDGSDFSAGDVFVKTWRLKNQGSCTWTPDYDLVFVGGQAMSAPAAVDLNTTVYPGGTVDVSIQLTAPDQEGTYQGYWQLRSGNGVVFGWGSNQSSSFWVQIDVIEDDVVVDPDSPLDFAFYYHTAKWYSSKGSISIYAGSDNYTNGSVSRTSSPVLEEGYQDDEPALIMIPSDGPGGVINGRFPVVNIHSGDRFHALIGCTGNKPKCDVMFQVNYSADGGAATNLGSWTEIYDGNWTLIDLDLTALAGKSVEFTLLVHNNGSSSDDRVFWLAPKIVR
ncbi:MAG: NBR1-Ig-like domain-containing protein [Anaerolineaceae bacterium]|nr:NBR1-Ig-like domain-containing protein [Anaerolineaceae bacterium]